MQFVVIFGGGWLGAILASGADVFAGFVFGAIITWIITRQVELSRKLDELNQDLTRGLATVNPRPPKAPSKESLTGADAADQGEQKPEKSPATETLAADPEPDAAPARAYRARAAQAIKTPSPHTTAAAQKPAEPDLFEKGIAAAKQWLTTGNVPVKVGVLVLFFGVAFLLKYAVDRQIVMLSIEARYLLIAIVAVGVFAFGWRLRSTMRVYALSLQGGAIGALYLTIFAAFRLHPILPSMTAFALLIALTAITGWLAVRQDAHPLALLGTVGGFLAPILVSTGSGNHIALFGYYLVLNVAVLFIAWNKTWRLLNIVSFVFTFGVGAMWGYEYYAPPYFATVEPFLIAFFLFYHAIAILFATRQPPQLRGWVDGTLVFGLPAVVFALQSALLEGQQTRLAISAVVLAAVYSATAYGLVRFDRSRMRTLIESYLVIAVAFITIAIPLALDDRWTAVAWALEGAALVWLGLRQTRLLSQVTGIVLLFGSAIAYVAAGWTHKLGMPILNGNVLSGLVIASLSLWSGYRFHGQPDGQPWNRLAATALLLLGTLFWLGVGVVELDDRIAPQYAPHAYLLFFSVTFAGMAYAAARLAWSALQIHAYALLPLLPILAVWFLLAVGHLYTATGTLVWLIAVAAHLFILRLADSSRAGQIWHYAGALFFSATLIHEIGWRIHEWGFSDVWVATGTITLAFLLGVLSIIAKRRIDWPLRTEAIAYDANAVTLTGLGLIALLISALNVPGDPAPMPYLPVLNPFDILTIAAIGALLFVFRGDRVDPWLRVDEQLSRYGIAVVAFILSTIAVVRAVHFLAEVAWTASALASSVYVQASLSIYWAILGLTGMVFGARRQQRTIWMVGAALMALVVAKLFLVDLGNTGTVARIVSFLGVGGMLLAVGYFAPAPPRTEADANIESD
ncbi:MAG: DUF2339 domain-containing protein [Pseudomonadota bacterium]